MASDLALSLSIGATIAGSFTTAFSSASDSLEKLTNRTTQLTARHERLGKVVSAFEGRPSSALGKWESQYKKIGKLIEKNRKAQEKLNESITKTDKLSQRRADMRSSAMETIGTGTAFAAPFIAGAKAAIDFESSMAEVNKTVGFESKESLQAFGSELKDLSTRLPVSANDLTGIAAAGGQLGIAKEDLIGYTETIAKMSVAFDMSSNEAGDSMAKLANVYKLPIDSIGEVGDAINALSNSSPAKANEIVNTLGRVGGLANQFGLTVNETTALSGAFIALGKSPEVAGTAINGMMTTLSTLDPKNKKQVAAFKQMGLDMGKFSELVKTDGQGAIMSLLDSINLLPEEDRIGMLTGLFGREYADDIAALSGGIETYKGQLETLQAVDENGNPQYIGSMAKEFASISGTTDNKLQLFKNNLNLLAINIGDALIPALNEAVLTIQPFIQKIAKFAEENPKVVKSLALFVGGLFAGKMAVIGIKYGLNLLFAGFTGIRLPLQLFHAQLGIVRSVLALGLPAKGINRFSGKIKRLNKTIIRFKLMLGRGLLSGVRLFSSGMGKLSGVVLKASRILGSAGLKGFIKLGGGLLKLGRIMRVVGLMFMTNPILIAVAAIAVAAFLIYRNWDKIKPYFAKLWTKLKAFANSGVGNILKTIASFSPIGLFIRAWSFVFSYFKGLVPKFRSYGSSIIQGLIGGITAKFGALKDKISGMADSIANVFSGKLEINSPSKLFMRIAGSIPEGAGVGVKEKAHLAIGAVKWMANKITGTKIQAPEITGDMTARLAQTHRSNAVLTRQATHGGGMNAGTIHFSPTINVQVGDGSQQGVANQVKQGISASIAEFERILEQVEYNRQRRAFA